MKYLNKREDFLREKNSNSINKIRSINEEAEFNSGPFANDVGWNDSLLGRLINHIIRKARIARKVGQIKKLIERLQEQFDYLVDQSTVFSLGDDSQLLLLRITLSSFFKELIFAVENNRPVSELIGLTDGAIKAVNDVKELDKKDVLLEELKKFRDFLNQFKDEEDSGDDSGENSESGSGDADAEGIVANSYGLMVKNLKALALILTNYKKVNTGASTGATGKPKITYITKNGDKLNLIQSDNTKNPKKLDIATIRSKNPKLSTYAKDDQSLPSGMVLLMEATVDTIGTGGAANRGKTVVGEDHLTQAFNKLKKDIEVLISPKEKGIAVDYTLINDIATNSNNTDSKKLIKNLYNEVNRYLVGDKKATIQEKDKLYNEGIEILNDKNKIVVIAEKIARFSKRALQFEKEGLYGGLGDLKVPLQTFVTTLLQINKVPIVTAKKESLFNYSSFLEAKNILPSGKPDTATGATATGTPQGGTASGDTQGQAQGEGDQSKKILEFFNKTCVEVRAFTATDEEITKLKEELENKKKEGGEVIMTMDPIIEIMNLFIKAYKLYTVQTITKRSEKVDTNTLSEYTSFGGNSSDGGDSGRNGPYRNNKLFDAWEEGVNDIRKNRKYQVFFTKNAKLRLPTVPDPNPAKADNWEIKDNAGLNFNRFINDILDGEKLYKSGTDRGKVAVFVDSYFGEGSVTKNGEGSLATLDEKDLTDAKALEDSKQKLSLELGKVNPALKGVDLKANTIFTITYKNDDDATRQRTFLIHEVSNGNVYMSYTLINYYKNKYLNRMNGPQKEIVKGAFPVNLANDGTLAVQYTMVKVNEFDNIFKPNNTITVSSVDNDGAVTSPVFKSISEIYWLVYTENKKIYTIDDTTEPKLDKVILQAGNKPCKTTVNSKSGIQIKKS